jgi:acetyltransferase-like isoleucine patch superfamily enzyme
MMMWRKFVAVLLLPMPSFIKVFLYRHLARYSIGQRVRIGFSLIVAERCEIGEGTSIGHLNVLFRTKHLVIGRNVEIGHANLMIGGEEISLGDGVVISRFNEINSILEPLVTNPTDPRLIIQPMAVITASHKIDFSDRVEIGESVVLAGRNSNIWTHNRQQTKPVKIGQSCYIGANVQFAPGSSVGSHCVIALGSVVTKAMDVNWMLIGGVPARPIKSLDEESRSFVTFPTRPDLII